MKLKFHLNIILMLLALSTYCQQPFCADSSVRVRYIFGNEGASLFNYADTIGGNTFTGFFREGLNTGIALLKTDWGDSMILAKKIYVDGNTGISLLTNDGSIISSGYWGIANNEDLLLSRLNSNGTVQWIKRYHLNQNHLRFNNGIRKNIFILNDAIYLNGTFVNTALVSYNVIAKFDLNGNILWSISFRVNTLGIERAFIINTPTINNDTVVFAANYYQQTGSAFTNFLNVLTRLNDSDGSLIETEAIKITSPDTLGLNSTQFNINSLDNSFSLMGNLIIKTPVGIRYSSIIFNASIDNYFKPIHGYFYKNDILNVSDLYYDFNSRKQHAFLSSDGSDFKDKYLTIFDKNDRILSTRKFLIPSILSSINQTSVNLDDKENLHFLFHYPQSGKKVTEYARISNFAPNSTLGCFGKDTSLLTTFPLTLVKEPFTWDFVDTDLITGIDVPYTEDTAIVTKQLVCKLVSYCDSVHISGPATACINQPVRYTVTKNTACLKSLQWNIDTAIATIINTEADTAITLSFKQAFTGYIHAAVYNCVVTDSFFVTVKAPDTLRITNRDSLLCPGKLIVLKANPGFAAYKWQDGSTADTLRVTAAGFYKVTGTDNCGFKTADSIVVNNIDTSLTITATQTICLYDTAFIILPPDVNNITWQPATNGLFSNKTLRLFPRQTTTYQITAERLTNCTLTATSQVVIENCVGEIFIPTAFTPNNDTRNDVFKASAFRPLQAYHLEIYNRYGQKIFETNNIATGWDGNFKGSPLPIGGYTYRVSYQFTGRPPQSEAGYFILLR